MILLAESEGAGTAWNLIQYTQPFVQRVLIDICYLLAPGSQPIATFLNEHSIFD